MSVKLMNAEPWDEDTVVVKVSEKTMSTEFLGVQDCVNRVCGGRMLTEFSWDKVYTVGGETLYQVRLEFRNCRPNFLLPWGVYEMSDFAAVRRIVGIVETKL